MDHNFTNQATIWRSTVTGNKTSYSAAETIACHIQPLSYGYNAGQAGRDGKDYRLFSTLPLEIGERIVDENGQKYEVTGVQHHQYRGRSHYQSDLRSS
jgi:hypothetical protein